MGYQTIDVPQGSFIGWGSKPGQVIEGRVTDYDPEGATDFGGAKCPSLEIELTRQAHSFVNGEWSTYEAGELVQMSCGQVQLKKKIRKAQPRIGDMIRIELSEMIKVANGTVKSFTVAIDRTGGNGSGSTSSAAPPVDEPANFGGGSEDEPPF